MLGPLSREVGPSSAQGPGEKNSPRKGEMEEIDKIIDNFDVKYPWLAYDSCW